MGNAFLYGNGGNNLLDFKVVGGTTQPSSLANNIIWVNTSTTITSWIFSPVQPTSVSNGMVWFEIGSGSAAEFNMLKKNAVMMNPIACYQYVSGKFVQLSAYLKTSSGLILCAYKTKYFIENGVIDLNKYEWTSKTSQGDAKTISNGNYEGMPAVVFGGSNGYWTTATIKNVEVPDWATTFTVEYYHISCHEQDATINLGDIRGTIAHVAGGQVYNGQVRLDISSIAGSPANFTIRFIGNAGGAACHLKNAYFN